MQAHRRDQVHEGLPRRSDNFFEKMCSVYESLSVEDKPTFRKFFGRGAGQLKKEKDPENLWLKVDKICKMRPVPSRAAALCLLQLLG